MTNEELEEKEVVTENEVEENVEQTDGKEIELADSVKAESNEVKEELPVNINGSEKMNEIFKKVYGFFDKIGEKILSIFSK